MRTRLRDEQGASAVEFAFIVPLLLVLVLGIAEFGHAFQVQGTLSAAVRDASPTLDPPVTNAQITVTPQTGCPLNSTTTQNVRVTIAYPMPFLTGFFGADIDLTGTGVMRCNG